VSLLVSLIFWPRGAAKQLRAAATAYVVAGSEALVRSIGQMLSAAPPPTAGRGATPARLRAQQALNVYLGERGTKPRLTDHARALLSAGRALDLSATSIEALAGHYHGDTGCPTAVAAVERSADAVAARVVAAASREPLPPADDPRPSVVACFSGLTDHAPRAVRGALRLVWAEAWVHSIDDLAVHLAAAEDDAPTPAPTSPGGADGAPHRIGADSDV